MDILIKAAQLILSLSILVVLHELGHFIPAKLFKTRVEKFYLFFNPWFSVFKIKKGETEYGLGWLPLGGYVKIAGMIDESMDKDQMKKPAEPWEFRSKPAWQRLIIMTGGVIMNIIVGMVIYVMIMFVWGETYLPTDRLTYGIAVDSTSMAMGFRDGDRIVSVDGKTFDRFNKIPGRILLDGAQTVTVNREGQVLDIPLGADVQTKMMQTKSPLFYEAYPFIADSVIPGSPAEKAGLRENDVIVGLNGEEIGSYVEYTREMAGKKESAVTLTVSREGRNIDLDVKTSADGTIGVYAVPPFAFFDYEKKKYSFAESIPVGLSRGKETLVDYVKQFKLLFTAEGAKQIGGFATFGNLFSPKWNWQSFWAMTAFISIILAVMNILPIPALDGGHVMFLLYEMVARRKPNEKVMEVAQYIGMLILFALVILANLNDIRRLF